MTPSERKDSDSSDSRQILIILVLTCSVDSFGFFFFFSFYPPSVVVVYSRNGNSAPETIHSVLKHRCSVSLFKVLGFNKVKYPLIK